MDITNLIFPMTAGDLVQSAVIVGMTKHCATLLFEVTGVSPAASGGDILEIDLRETISLERMTVHLKPDTPVLVTSIRRV